MRRCDANEHFYDENKHTGCPHCVGLKYSDNKSRDTVKVDNKKDKSLPTAEQQTSSAGSNTIVAWGNKKGTPDKPKETIQLKQPVAQQKNAPVVGWFVIIKGKGEGTDFRIIPGMNTLGRESSNAISIDFGDTSISREKHCTIIFDYKNKLFFLQHGDGANLTYLNGNVVLTPTQLKAGDILDLGDTKLKFIPFCCEDFCWEL
jgi:hypothetical protein